MSNRFPPLADQPRPPARAIASSLAQSLPWLELGLGLAMLLLLRAV